MKENSARFSPLNYRGLNFLHMVNKNQRYYYLSFDLLLIRKLTKKYWCVGAYDESANSESDSLLQLLWLYIAYQAIINYSCNWYKTICNHFTYNKQKTFSDILPHHNASVFSLSLCITLLNLQLHRSFQISKRIVKGL